MDNLLAPDANMAVQVQELEQKGSHKGLSAKAIHSGSSIWHHEIEQKVLLSCLSNI